MNKNEFKLKFCKGDLIAIAVVIALIVLSGFLFWKVVGTEEGSMVVVYEDGKVIREIPLTEETEFVVEGLYTNKIAVRDGKAAVIESDCPGGDCMHSGWISESGRSIICLPNRVEVRIEDDSDVDFVVR